MIMSDQEVTSSCQHSPLNEGLSWNDEESETSEFVDTLSQLPPARVRFAQNLVTEIRYRPRTLPEDMALLYYQDSEMKKLRAEYIALKQEYRRRRISVQQVQQAPRPTKTMLSRFLGYVFTVEETSSSFVRMPTTLQTDSSTVKTSELLYSWDLGLISASF
mmetsp:Transcript_2933/g.4430  ORF Transcript_2933/g.4430 Transcript_2933/m.4430 type:complete len:161 (+) Transcript_2933:110-592(+)